MSIIIQTNSVGPDPTDSKAVPSDPHFFLGVFKKHDHTEDFWHHLQSKMSGFQDFVKKVVWAPFVGMEKCKAIKEIKIYHKKYLDHVAPKLLTMEFYRGIIRK